MDKHNFPDLEKITAPFGLLDNDTQNRAIHSKAAGHKWEVLDRSGRWCQAREAFKDHLTYRRAPAPVTQMTVPWHLVPACYDDAAAFAFGVMPGDDEWRAMTFQIKDLPGFDRGTVNWKDSFQRRPLK